MFHRIAVTLALTTALVLSGCSGDDASKPSGAADNVTELCGLMVKIPTDIGVMKNKKWDILKFEDTRKRIAMVTESLRLRDEALSLAPAEIKDILEDQLDYFEKLPGKDPARGKPFDPDKEQKLRDWQEDKCGITGL